MSPIHQYPTINYLTILTLSHQYLTSISRPGAASIHQYLTSINISPVSHRYLTSISPVSHQYLTAWCRQYLTSILPSPVLSHISPLLSSHHRTNISQYLTLMSAAGRRRSTVALRRSALALLSKLRPRSPFYPAGDSFASRVPHLRRHARVYLTSISQYPTIKLLIISP
jgi:hypothetical protein